MERDFSREGMRSLWGEGWVYGCGEEAFCIQGALLELDGSRCGGGKLVGLTCVMWLNSNEVLLSVSK